jgi:gamma-glutamyl hercynylcysteine S-oxide synthase
MKLKMRKLQKTPWFWLAIAGGAMLLQWVGRGTFLMWALVPILGYAVWRSIKLIRERLPERFVRKTKQTAKMATAAIAEPAAPPDPPRRRRNDNPGEINSLVEQMLLDGRYGLLLRPQIAPDLTRDMFQRAYHALEDEMALVPTGEVGIELQDFSEPKPEGVAHEVPEAVVRVNSLFMDRYPVTNEQFQSFVDAGGYEQSSLWHPEILPAVLDFVDRTGNPGPRFWRNGRYEPGKAKHPVIGVSWYEANAYARWVGKRLPTDAEWVKAAAWPVAMGTSTRRQRRFPWGQTMDRERANLWTASVGHTVSVEEFADGVSVGGIYQLIGNVWEWTLGDFDAGYVDSTQEDLEPSVLKNIRGGAFDTYFDNQATCQFSSGEHPLARKHNIGFRCVLGTCDLAVDPTTQNGAPANAREEQYVTCEVTA